MGCTQSKSSEAVVAKEPSLAKKGKLTSEAYGSKNPPTHWSDAVFLVPHEYLRGETACMLKSVDALPASTTEEDSWKAELFATWIVEFLVPMIHLHHENEEKIYLPLMVEKGCKVPENISPDHETLMQALSAVGEVAKSMVEAKGLDCSEAIKKLKSLCGPLVKEMNVHLKEEEKQLAPQIKEHLTEEDHKGAVQKIYAAAGPAGLEMEVPAVIYFTKEWATEEYYKVFEAELPPPILKIAEEVLLPNYHSYFCAMRDAPTLKEKPGLDRLPFDPSQLPPSPGAEAAPEAPAE